MRRPPESNKQRFPEATLHVGQRTDRNSSGVMSFIRIGIYWDKKGVKTAQNGTLISILPKFLIILKFPFQVLNYSKALRTFGFAGVLDEFNGVYSAEFRTRLWLRRNGSDVRI